jgi:hypothetical protein
LIRIWRVCAVTSLTVAMMSCRDAQDPEQSSRPSFERFTCDDGGVNQGLPCGGVGSAGPDTAYVTWNWSFPEPGLTPTNLRGAPSNPLWPGMPHDTIIDLHVHVDSIGGGYLPNRTVTLTAAAIDQAGVGVDGIYGHIHRDVGGVAKPAGGFLPGNSLEKIVNTGDSVVVVRFRTGQVSGPVILRAESEGAKPAVDTVPVGVFRLVPLAARASYTLTGDRPWHPQNHYVTQWMAELLAALADGVQAQFGRRLFYNDCSLPFGGVFDLAQKWEAQHFEHRAGVDCDLRTNGTTESGGLDDVERAFVWYRWERLGGQVIDETVLSDQITPNIKNPHYHLRFRGFQ